MRLGAECRRLEAEFTELRNGAGRSEDFERQVGQLEEEIEGSCGESWNRWRFTSNGAWPASSSSGLRGCGRAGAGRDARAPPLLSEVHDRAENSRPDLHVVKHPGCKALSDWSIRCQQQGAGGQEQCISHPGWSAIVRDSPFSQGLKRVLTISTLSARSPQMRGLFSHTLATYIQSALGGKHAEGFLDVADRQLIAINECTIHRASGNMLNKIVYEIANLVG